MVIDCFPFFQELDLLEIRLNVLKDVVDRFVLLEANETHSGKEKPYVFYEHQERFRDFPILYYKLTFPSGLSSWERENFQRRALYSCVEDELSVNDTVILSDLDEIPSPGRIREGKLGRYVQDMYYFFLNAYADQEWTSGTIVMCEKMARSRDWQDMRMDRSIPQVENGGWHFSSVGVIENVEDKMKSFAHTEYDNEEALNKVLDNYRNLKSIHGDSLVLEPMEMLPQYIQQNPDKYSHLFYHAI